MMEDDLLVIDDIALRGCYGKDSTESSELRKPLMELRQTIT